MGIGGGAITNLILTLHGVPIHRAVSTGAGVGVLIALPATLGYVYAGWGKAGLPFDATGYVSWLTFAATVPTTLLTARAGRGARPPPVAPGARDRVRRVPARRLGAVPLGTCSEAQAACGRQAAARRARRGRSGRCRGRPIRSRRARPT